MKTSRLLKRKMRREEMKAQKDAMRGKRWVGDWIDGKLVKVCRPIIKKERV